MAFITLSIQLLYYNSNFSTLHNMYYIIIFKKYNKPISNTKQIIETDTPFYFFFRVKLFKLNPNLIHSLQLTS